MSTMQAIRIHQTGGPEVLKFEEKVDKPVPKDNEALVKVAAVGVNFIDTYLRSGLYPMELPGIIGREAAGVIESVGKNVQLPVGSRVVFFYPGSYAQYVAVPADKLMIVPADIPLKVAAASFLQGLTAHYLVYSTYPVRAGDWVLVHAAAGGTGSLIVQMAKAKGAKVICTVSTEEKANLVRSLGADFIINYAETDFQKEVMKITENKGVHVVYDGVGKSTWEGSLASLARRGYLVLFGNASGPVPPFDPLLLSKFRSVYVTRPTLVDYTAEPAELADRSRDLFEAITSGNLKIKIAKEFPLAEASASHEFLAGRFALGKVMLIPEGGDSIQ